MIINVNYLALCTPWQIVQNANRFSENGYYCGRSKEKLNIYKTETLVDLHQKHLSITIFSMIWLFVYCTID